MAGTSLKQHKTKYLADVNSDEAKNAGWVESGSETRHRSIICVPCFVADTAVGVMSLDSTELAGFSGADKKIIERCAKKAELVYYAFRDKTENNMEESKTNVSTKTTRPNARAISRRAGTPVAAAKKRSATSHEKA